GNFAHLGWSNLKSLVFAAALCLFLSRQHFAPFFFLDGNAGGLLQKYRGGRTFHLENESAIVEHRDHAGYGHSTRILGSVVELGYELANVNPMLAQCRTNRRRRRRLPARTL